MVANETISDPSLNLTRTWPDIMVEKLREAHSLVTKHRRLVAQTMDSRPVPEGIWELYWDIICNRFPQAMGLKTTQRASWKYLRLCVAIVLSESDPEGYRLAMLQAIHYGTRHKLVN